MSATTGSDPHSAQASPDTAESEPRIIEVDGFVVSDFVESDYVDCECPGWLVRSFEDCEEGWATSD